MFTTKITADTDLRGSGEDTGWHSSRLSYGESCNMSKHKDIKVVEQPPTTESVRIHPAVIFLDKILEDLFSLSSKRLSLW